MTLLDALRSRLTNKTTAARESMEVVWKKYAGELARGDDTDADRLADLAAQLGLSAEIAVVHERAISRAAELEATARETAGAANLHDELKKQMDALLEQRQKTSDDLSRLHASSKEAEQAMRSHENYVDFIEAIRHRMPGLFGLPLNVDSPPRLRDYGVDNEITTVARELDVQIPPLGTPWPAGAGTGGE